MAQEQFWLKPFLFKLLLAWAEEERSWQFSFLCLRLPSHGTQRMEFDSSAGGVGASCPGVRHLGQMPLRPTLIVT